APDRTRRGIFQKEKQGTVNGASGGRSPRRQVKVDQTTASPGTRIKNIGSLTLITYNCTWKVAQHPPKTLAQYRPKTSAPYLRNRHVSPKQIDIFFNKRSLSYESTYFIINTVYT